MDSMFKLAHVPETNRQQGMQAGNASQTAKKCVVKCMASETSQPLQNPDKRARLRGRTVVMISPRHWYARSHKQEYVHLNSCSKQGGRCAFKSHSTDVVGVKVLMPTGTWSCTSNTMLSATLHRQSKMPGTSPALTISNLQNNPPFALLKHRWPLRAAIMLPPKNPLNPSS